MKDWVDFAMLFTLETTRKAGGLQILCCQGIKVTDYNFTLDALALKSSDFCNVRVFLVVKTCLNQMNHLIGPLRSLNIFSGMDIKPSGRVITTKMVIAPIIMG